MMDKLWFISYLVSTKDMIEDTVTKEYCNIITDVTPVNWMLESQYALGGERVILYAEEISHSLAVELSHGGAGVPTVYFK